MQAGTFGGWDISHREIIILGKLSGKSIMALKLKVGMAFEPEKISLQPSKSENRKKPKKKIKITKELIASIAWKDIFSSFGISVLVLFNVFLLGVAFVWFNLLFSFISPVELMNMYGINTSAEVVQGFDSAEISDFGAPPAPALGGN